MKTVIGKGVPVTLRSLSKQVGADLPTGVTGVPVVLDGNMSNSALNALVKAVGKRFVNIRALGNKLVLNFADTDK